MNTNFSDETEFKEAIVNSLQADNILEFQKALRQKLQDTFDVSMDSLKRESIQLKEELDPENKSRIDIESAARAFGGNKPIYDEGVLIVDFDDKLSAKHFSEWLDKYKTVETYELNILTNIDGDDENDDELSVIDIDFESINDDDEYTFEFIVYLVPEIVSYSDEEYEEEDEEEDEDEEDNQITEVTRKIKMSSLGKKTIKMKCQPGFKWDSGLRSCQKISGQALVVIRKAVKKRLITMKSEGPSLKKRTLKKMRKALRFRRAMGL